MIQKVMITYSIFESDISSDNRNIMMMIAIDSDSRGEYFTIISHLRKILDMKVTSKNFVKNTNFPIDTNLLNLVNVLNSCVHFSSIPSKMAGTGRNNSSGQVISSCLKINARRRKLCSRTIELTMRSIKLSL